MRYDGGFKLFAVSPEYVNSKMSFSTIYKTLGTLYDRVKIKIEHDLRSLHEECLGIRYEGAFLGAQLNLTAASGGEYITFTMSHAKKSRTDNTRVALMTQAFPGTHTADDIRLIEAVRSISCYQVSVTVVLVYCLGCSGGY